MFADAKCDQTLFVSSPEFSGELLANVLEVRFSFVWLWFMRSLLFVWSLGRICFCCAELLQAASLEVFHMDV